jgi:hypothetical protein
MNIYKLITIDNKYNFNYHYFYCLEYYEKFKTYCSNNNIEIYDNIMESSLNSVNSNIYDDL